MKKMRVSKRGFTLTEIIIVVAIMVIVASAAFVGVAVTLENARRNSDEVNRRHGVGDDGKDLFEADAWEEIDELTKGAANFFDVSLYKPDKPTNTPTLSPSPTPADDASDSDGDEITSESSESSESSKDTTTESTLSGNKVVATSTSTNASGSSTTIEYDWGSSGHGRMKFDKKVTSVTLYIPDGVELGKAWNDGISDPTKSVNGNYVTFTLGAGQSIDNIKYEIKKMDSNNKNKIRVYSYTTA